MPDVIIEDPVINSAYAEPQRHFRFGENGITDEIVPARRISQYFIPIAPTKKRGTKQLVFDILWTADRIKEPESINVVGNPVPI